MTVFFLNLKAPYLFTNSLNFLPAEKAGTVFAGILISFPDCGFLPVLAARFLESNVPKPTNVTFLPFETDFSTTSINVDKISETSF